MLNGSILLSRLNRSPEVSIHSVRRAGGFVKRVANSLALPGAACAARLQQTSLPEQLSFPIDASVYRELVEERKWGVDVLGVLVNTACLAGGMVLLGQLGTSVALRPWQRRLLALQGREGLLAADGVVQSAASAKGI
jgi:hypothetical protein